MARIELLAKVDDAPPYAQLLQPMTPIKQHLAHRTRKQGAPSPLWPTGQKLAKG